MHTRTARQKRAASRRALSAVLACLMAVTLLPTAAFAEDVPSSVHKIRVITIAGLAENYSYTIRSASSPDTAENTEAHIQTGEIVTVTLSTTKPGYAPQAVQFSNSTTWQPIEIPGYSIARDYDEPGVFRFTMPDQDVELKVTFGAENKVFTKLYYEPNGTATPPSADGSIAAVPYTSAELLSKEFTVPTYADYGIDGYLWKFSDGEDYGTVDTSGTHLIYTPNAAAANKTVTICVRATSGGGISKANEEIRHTVRVGAVPMPDYSRDASLSSLTYQIADGAEGTVDLQEDIYEYDVLLPFGTAIGKEITLEAATADSNAQITETQPGETHYTASTASVTVTAQDPSVVAEYSVHFRVAPDNIPYSVKNKASGEVYQDGDTIEISTESAVILTVTHGSGTGGAGAASIAAGDYSLVPVSESFSGVYPAIQRNIELRATEPGSTQLTIKFYAKSGTNFSGESPIDTITLHLVCPPPIAINPSGSTTTTTHNPDGSVTTTVKKPNGTVTQTTRAPDGTKTVVETKKDGSRVETVTTPDGGRTETAATPQGDVTYTQERPDGVKISADVPKIGGASATVEVPGGLAAPVVVSFPAADGTVALRLLPDGAEEPVAYSLVEDETVYVRLDGSAELRVETRAGLFDDMDGHWAEDSADFTGARELFQGTAPRTFAPEQPMTRAMLATVLYRLDGMPGGAADAPFSDVDGGEWYAGR